MVCIYCRGELSVTNSRPQKSRNQTWRRRLCKACGAAFTSTEGINLTQSLVVTKAADASRVRAEAGKAARAAAATTLEPFDRDRLFISLYESLRHRTSACSDARGLADTVTAQLISQAENGQLPVRAIIQTALNTLQRFDTAAATHYAAFHLQR